MSAAFTQIESMLNHAVCRGLSTKQEDGIWSIASDDSGARVELLRIDRESLRVPAEFPIGYGVFMLTQSREHGTRLAGRGSSLHHSGRLNPTRLLRGDLPASGEVHNLPPAVGG